MPESSSSPGHPPRHPALPAERPALATALAIVGGGALAVWLAQGWILQPRAVLPALLPEFPGPALAALAWVLLLGAAATAAGWLLLGPGPARAGRLAAAFLVGNAALGAVAAWLGLLPGGLLAAAAVGVLAVLCILAKAPRRGVPSMTAVWQEERLTWAALALPAAVAFVAALAPEVESDGVRYHLVLVQEWLRAGRLVVLPYNANSNLPAFQSLLALGYGAYQPLHALHGVALALLTAGLVRAFTRGRGAAALAGFLVLSLPVVTVVMAWPFSDVASAAYLLGALWVATPGRVRGARRTLLVGLLLGASVATKITVLPLAGLVGLWSLRLVRPRRMLREFLLLAACGALLMGPWLLKNALAHGNPVYPLAWGVLGGPEWSELNQAIYKERVGSKGLGKDAVALLRSPWDVTTAWPQFEGHNPGAVPLMALPGLLLAAWAVLRSPRRRAPTLGFLLGLLVIGWVFWFATYQSVRFLIPLLAVAVVAAVAALPELLGPRSWRIPGAVLAVGGVLGLAWTLTYHLTQSGALHAGTGTRGADVFLAQRFPPISALRELARSTTPNEPVLYIGEHRAYHAHPFRPLASDWFDTPRILVELRATPSNDALLADLHARGVRTVLYNQGELSLYAQAYFRPRFTDAEWERFEDFMARLTEDPPVWSDNAGLFLFPLPAAGS